MKSSNQTNGFLETRRIGISISDSHELNYLGYGSIHQKDAVVEFARYLLANHATMVYGHDLRMDGYAQLIAELTRAYAKPKELENVCVNYLAWPIHLGIKETDAFEFSELRIDVEKTDLPANELSEIPRNVFLPSNNIENRYAWARSLTNMREIMTEKTDARIFIGGQIKANKAGDEVRGYKGLMPGVLEEGLLALRDPREYTQPIYLMGAFGGATKAMIEAVKGNEPIELSLDYQVEHYPDYADFVKLYQKKHGKKFLDYKKITQEFAALGLAGLSERNGLTKEENERLFETPHISEMVRLVLTGLNNVFPKSASKED